MKHGLCAELTCMKSASYGFAKDNVRRYCAEHKEENMVNLTKRTCYMCFKTPSFGYALGKSSISCATHKEDGMLHTTNRKVNILCVE